MHNVYFFTDIHGNWDLYNGIKLFCLDQDPECTIIFGGDACDRGPYGYDIMKDMLKTPQIVYLKGNHEDLFVGAALEIIGHCAQSDELYNKLHNINLVEAQNLIKEVMNKQGLVNLHIYNGGAPTLLKWMLDGANEDFLDQINSLKYTFSYENLDFCHAGGSYETFCEVAQAEYENKPVSKLNKNELLWDRDLLDIGWNTNRICVHGHTPTSELANICSCCKPMSTIAPYVWIGYRDFEEHGGYRIDMDTGAIWTGVAFLLDCLTMKTLGFRDEDFQDKDKKEPHKIVIFSKYPIIKKT